MIDDSVTFWYRMSSEQDWDYLRYSEDGNELGAWSGITSWLYAGFPITSGSHTLKWGYDKDSDFSSGTDQAWLDNIRLPFGTQVTGVAQVTRQNGIAVWPNPSYEYLNVSVKETNERSISWRLQDLSGKEIQSGIQQQNFSSNDVFTINVQGLSAGMYILNLSNASMQKSVKVVVGE